MFVLVMLVALTSCASYKPVISKVAPPAPPPVPATPAPAEPAQDSQQTGAGPGPGAGHQPPPKSVDVPALSVPVLATGTQPQQGKPARAGPGGQPYQIQVENMPIGEFINLVFGKVLDVDYTVDKSVEAMKETVTLNMKTTARQPEILQIAREVFKGYGLDVTQKEGIYFVGPIIGQQQRPVVPYFVGNVPETVIGSDSVGLFLPVSYINPHDYQGIITPLALSAQGRVQPVAGSSMVCIIDDANHVRAAAELIQALDRPSLSNKKMRLFYLHYLPVETFVGYLAEALPAQGMPVAKTPAEPGIMLIPLKQIRAVLAVSLKPEWFDQIGFWQEKLDLRSVSEDEPHFYVYHPRYRRATDLAKLFQGTTTGSHKGSQTDQQRLATRPDATPETMGMSQTGMSQTGMSQTGMSQAGISQKGVSSPESEKTSQKTLSLAAVSVCVDENANSLVFMATPFQYSKVEELLSQLDVLPRQVLVEVTIGEVTLTGSLQYGIEWALKHNGLGVTQALGTLSGLGIGSSGFLYKVVSAGGNFEAVLNAFASDNVLKILSTPELVVLDNQDANINVGTQVPVLTSQSTAGIESSGTTSLLQTVQYIQTGVILHIKPTINSKGMLTLQLTQTVSDAETNTTSSISSPIITTREIDTSVALKSGSSVLLGGLIQNQVSNNVSKVPGLGDIPLIGQLFKTTTRGTTRDELFIVITPHILTTAEEAEDATRNFKDLLDLFKQ
jgi:general secretion pathway protein D